MSYSRNSVKQPTGSKNALAPRSAPESTSNAKSEEMIPMNGFGQVIEMLRAADPAFRQSLLKRISLRDPDLLKMILEELKAY